MKIAFDPAKDASNIAKHGLSLGGFHGFDTDVVAIVDDRFDYGETRFQARGRINGIGYCVIYVETDEGVRVISVRRAHDKEMRRYE
ncbi:BrnT family toxin [Sphingomonas faeni]|uniref:BrnT family toxin n=1 Tax=Sphingomonas faeni TaxID=185950 RepID=UPI003356782C